jgi:hypothetical protein
MWRLTLLSATTSELWSPYSKSWPWKLSEQLTRSN